MTPVTSTDVLEVVNGPEDGTQFPLARTPVTLGSDSMHGVAIRLDPGVLPSHARITAAADGYRIRSIDGAPVWVDGKRAGIVRSRILRDQGLLKTACTELVLVCAAGGLAERSRGLPSESDLAWAASLVLRRGALAGRVALRSLWWMLRPLLRYAIPLGLLLLLARVFFPRQTIMAYNYVLDFAWYLYYAAYVLLYNAFARVAAFFFGA